MARPKPYKKPPLPRHTFTRYMDDFEIKFRENDGSHLDLRTFDDMLSKMKKMRDEAEAALKPNEVLKFIPMAYDYNYGGIVGFMPVADRTESDEEYSARLRGYAEREAKKAAERSEQTAEKIRRLEKQIEELKKGAG